MKKKPEGFVTFTRIRNGKEETVTRKNNLNGLSKIDGLYKVWGNMRRRCNDENTHNYKWYGGKGIRVHDDWNDYLKFREWALENGYSQGLQLDRIDPDKNYEPTNCRWITTRANLRNRDLYWSDELDEQVINKAKELGINTYEFIKIAVESYLNQ
jgi:hypothetical protein